MGYFQKFLSTSFWYILTQNPACVHECHFGKPEDAGKRWNVSCLKKNRGICDILNYSPNLRTIERPNPQKKNLNLVNWYFTYQVRVVSKSSYNSEMSDLSEHPTKSSFSWISSVNLWTSALRVASFPPWFLIVSNNFWNNEKTIDHRHTRHI